MPLLTNNDINNINNNFERININLEYIKNMLNLLLNNRLNDTFYTRNNRNASSRTNVTNFPNTPTMNSASDRRFRMPNRNTTIPENIEISFMDPRGLDIGNIFSNLFPDLSTNTNIQTVTTHTTIMNNTKIEIIDRNIDETCSICRENFETNNIIRKLNNCNHFFHQSCVDNWFANNITCPLCRTDIRESNNSESPTTHAPRTTPRTTSNI